MKIYKASLLFNCEIIEMELISETHLFVTVIDLDGRKGKQKRETYHHKFFNSYNECKEWLMSKLDLEIYNQQIHIDKLKSKKQKVNNL